MSLQGHVAAASGYTEGQTDRGTTFRSTVPNSSLVQSPEASARRLITSSVRCATTCSAQTCTPRTVEFHALALSWLARAGGRIAERIHRSLRSGPRLACVIPLARRDSRESGAPSYACPRWQSPIGHAERVVRTTRFGPRRAERECRRDGRRGGSGDGATEGLSRSRIQAPSGRFATPWHASPEPCQVLPPQERLPTYRTPPHADHSASQLSPNIEPAPPSSALPTRLAGVGTAFQFGGSTPCRVRRKKS